MKDRRRKSVDKKRGKKTNEVREKKVDGEFSYEQRSRHIDVIQCFITAHLFVT